MKCFKQSSAGAAIAALALTGAAQAQINTSNEEIFVDGGTVETSNGGTVSDSTPGDTDQLFTIDRSVTLSADNWYNLRSRVVVQPGATLTIEPGTVFASDKAGADQGGSLVITPGAQIIAEGTPEKPIIFTSKVDLGNWADDASHTTGKDPRNRGQWRAGVDEWGSIAILGEARISDTRQNPSNGTAFNVDKETGIEGLPNLVGGVNNYGGLDDNDDSGVMRYVSISYGGDNFDPTTDSELNGMSWGGVGSEFDASHIEIFNNVDDGLEIFGGKANVKNLLVWNIGDDSLDVDQGWRGKVQFALLIQGAGGAENQGSGFGDNGIEADGTDGDTTAQPITAASVWNATIIGAPEVTGDDPANDNDSSDRVLAFRDNLNMQIWNTIFMTDGENMLNNDGDDGDGSTGYGAGTTLDFATRWNTPASWYTDPANGFPNQGSAAAADFEAAYTAQDPTANLLQIAGSLWFGINDPGELLNVGVLPGTGVGTENATLDNKVVGTLPIAGLTRADGPVGVFSGGTVPGGNPFVVLSDDFGDGVIGNVTSIDPRAVGDALAVNRPMMFQPPQDGFYTTPTNFRGAVAPNSNWALGWSAITAVENADGDKIMTSPANPADPTGLDITVAPTISFQSVDGVLYDIVAVDADGNQRIVATVEGDGSVISVADVLNAPLDASQKYIVRVSTL